MQESKKRLQRETSQSNAHQFGSRQTAFSSPSVFNLHSPIFAFTTALYHNQVNSGKHEKCEAELKNAVTLIQTIC